jgi:cytochrome c5
MKIPVPLQIAALTVGMTGFYTLVGQAVPQKEVHPPEVIEVSDTVTTAELIEIGKTVFEGKGLCTTCHTIGKSGALRFPDLQGIAERAASQLPGYTQLDYLAESLYDPEVYIVPGFNPGMPVINKPPIGLTDVEIIAVISYLQTLGGEATVTIETKFVYTGGTREADAVVAGETVVAEETVDAAGEAAGEATGDER